MEREQMKINEMVEFLDNSTDKREKYIRKAWSQAMNFFRKHKSKIKYKDELEDMVNDLICELYECYDKWHELPINEFCSKCTFKLLAWEKTILTRYHGIKVTRTDIRDSKKNTTKIELGCCSFSDEIGL